jgi:HEAT repeat protein
MKQIILTGLVVLMMVGCSKKRNEYTAPSLLQQLKDPDPKMRYYAAKELGHFGAQAGEVVPALIEALKDQDKDVRMRAAYSLAEIGPDAKPAIPALDGAAKDPEAEVRTAANQALKTLRNPSPPGKDEPKSGNHRHIKTAGPQTTQPQK